MKLFRYEKVCYHETLRGWENENNVEIILREFEIIKNTPKGYVIKYGLKEKWISSSGKKKICLSRKRESVN